MSYKRDAKRNRQHKEDCDFSPDNVEQWENPESPYYKGVYIGRIKCNFGVGRENSYNHVFKRSGRYWFCPTRPDQRAFSWYGDLEK